MAILKTDLPENVPWGQSVMWAPFQPPLSHLPLPYFTKERHNSSSSQILTKMQFPGNAKISRTPEKEQLTGEWERDSSFYKSDGFQLLAFNEVEKRT